LLKLPVPVMAPEKVELVALPSVRVMPVNPNVPEPLKSPTVWLMVVISTVPLLIVKTPKLFAPDRVNTPVPCFVKPPVPVRIPENNVLLDVPSVRVPVPKVRLPAPLKSPMVWLKLFRLKTVPADMETLPVEARHY